MARARVFEVRGGSIRTPDGRVYSRNPMRGYGPADDPVSVEDAFDQARRVREEFYGKAMREHYETDLTWPRFVKYVGITNAEQYLSDKKLADWKLKLFKHVAEDEQYLFINDRITTLLNDRGEPVQFREIPSRRMQGPGGGSIPNVFYCQTYEIGGPMPRHFAELAEDKGIQWVTADGQYWELRLPGCKLCAAPLNFDGQRARRSGAQVLLFSHSNEGIHYIVTGRKLNVTPDGIVH